MRDRLLLLREAFQLDHLLDDLLDPESPISLTARNVGHNSSLYDGIAAVPLMRGS